MSAFTRKGYLEQLEDNANRWADQVKALEVAGALTGHFAGELALTAYYAGLAADHFEEHKRRMGGS